MVHAAWSWPTAITTAPSPWRRVAAILLPVYVAFFATLGLATYVADPAASDAGS